MLWTRVKIFVSKHMKQTQKQSPMKTANDLFEYQKSNN